MKARDAVGLIEKAIPRTTATWADIGAGAGTFTHALAQLLEPGSRIYAVDRDARALTALEREVAVPGVQITTVTADFTLPFELPDLGPGGLDGLLLANALHFARDAAAVVARLATLISRGGRLVVVEYDGRAASRWVPFPLSPARLTEIAAQAGLEPVAILATRRSAYGGTMYVAAANRA
jgi:SAM-dependent methyltransferase